MLTSPSTDALLIFARYPRLGRVKTRLSELLGERKCLQLYSAFLLDTLERTAGLGVTRYLFLADCSLEEAEGFADIHGFSSRLQVRTQQGQNLGDRMWEAVRWVSPKHHRIVFVGTDTPSLPLSYVRAAFEELPATPVVIGPVEDGGYYLLGITRPRRELFSDIDWGTRKVLRQTLSRLQPREYKLLPCWYDVDIASDLRRLKEDLFQNFEGFPRRTDALLAQLELDRD